MSIEVIQLIISVFLGGPQDKNTKEHHVFIPSFVFLDAFQCILHRQSLWLHPRVWDLVLGQLLGNPDFLPSINGMI